MLNLTDIKPGGAAAIGRAPQQDSLIEEGGEPICNQTTESSTGSTEVGLFQDIPRWIWRTFLSAWATIFGLFLTFFTITAEATFGVAIAAFTGLMAFGLVIALVAQTGSVNPQHKRTVHTHTGPLGVWAAAAQIVLIPVGSIFGLIGFIIFAM